MGPSTCLGDSLGAGVLLGEGASAEGLSVLGSTSAWGLLCSPRPRFLCVFAGNRNRLYSAHLRGSSGSAPVLFLPARRAPDSSGQWRAQTGCDQRLEREIQTLGCLLSRAGLSNTSEHNLHSVPRKAELGMRGGAICSDHCGAALASPSLWGWRR